MHPLVCAIKRLDANSQELIDHYLHMHGMLIRHESADLKRLQRLRRRSEISGAEAFLLMTKMRQSARRFRKLTRKLMKHAPLGAKTPRHDPWWELAAHALRTMAWNDAHPIIRKRLKQPRRRPMYRRVPRDQDLW